MVPLGSSYFTFAALGYIIDVYRGKTRAERNPLYYALFVSFFPCIVTGPIERAGNLLPQFKRKVTFDYNRVSGGMFRILWGCFKKLVIADTIGGIVGTVFGKPAQYSGPILLIACLLFTYQLYCDFSAASDIGHRRGSRLRDRSHGKLHAAAGLPRAIPSCGAAGTSACRRGSATICISRSAAAGRESSAHTSIR